MGPGPTALAVLQLLEDQARGFRHHLLHDLAHRLVGLLELADERRQHREVPLLRLEAHRRRPAVHRLHEATMRGGDLPVEILLEPLLVHARSIERRPRRFNAIAAVVGLALALATPARALEVPGSGGRLAVGGWLDGLAVAATEDSPRQQPRALLDLHLDGEAARWLHGRLDVRTRVGGPYEGGHPGVFNLNHEYQNRSPSLEVNEAYGDVRLHSADLRLGIQKVAWGKLDGVPPTDLLNPRDFHDPIVDDVEERKIGIPMAVGTYYLPDLPRLDLSGLRATLVWIPIAVPPRLALIEERWFPSASAPGDVFLVSKQALQRFGVPATEDLRVPIALHTLNHRPPRSLSDGGGAVRIGGTWREMDWDLYHYTGPETGPDTDLRSTATLFSSKPLRVRSRAVLRQAHDAIHMNGADAATVLGGFTVRAEAAWFDDHTYLRPAGDLAREIPLRPVLKALAAAPGRPVRVPLGTLFPSLDTVEWGVGADYLVDGWQPLLQLNQIVLLEPAPRLLIADPETRLTAILRKRVLADRLEFEGKGIYALERGGWFFFPRVSYQARDDLRLRLGYLAIGGPRTSILGQFGHNDEVVIQARYSF